MCGIVGTIGCGSPEQISKLASRLAHRGPDRQAVQTFTDPFRVNLGHTRLSILDLSEGGNQPMATEDRRYWIVYNGEVYNYAGIADSLKAEFGETFHSTSDTEVVLKSFRYHGEKIFSQFNGIFAFCLYDREKQRIYLVRDHLGIKPLYYHHAGNKLVFASEIKAILESGMVDPTALSAQAMWHYFTFLYVPSPLTIYEQIKQIPPAHYLCYDLATSQMTLHRYWEPVSHDSFSLIEDYHEAKHLVAEQVKASVSMQMVSDVPIGAFLSGGIDSNIVVGSMAQASDRPVNTFTAVFSNPDLAYFNERNQARRISDKFHTDHQEIEIPTPKIYDVFEIARMMDQPFGNPTLFLSHLISKGLRTKVAVALSGAGGDELFGGYVRYRAVLLDRYVRKLPPFARDGITAIVSMLPNSNRNPKVRRLKEFWKGLHPDPVHQYVNWTYFLNGPEKESLLKPGFLADQPSDRPDSAAVLAPFFDQYPEFELLNRVQWMDINSYLLNDILSYTDISGMANSLEIRVPLLDKDLVELSLRIPQRFKIGKGRTKRVLTDAFKGIFPVENLQSPKKGFSLPIAYMLSGMEEYFEKEFDRSGFLQKNVFNRECIERFRAQHRRHEVDRSLVLFGIIQFDAWWRQFVKL